MTTCVDIRYCRLLERPFRRSRPNCLAAMRSLQRPSIILSGPLLLCIQVRLATLQSDGMRNMLTVCVGRSLVPFFASIGGADTVRLSHLVPRVHDH